ncbi:hypothetical protein B0J14DRAFT_302893 [Halenospora varia]|nr:hypothetical protein B0J14DRAFT_302893 [Halenospora varia]
MSPNPNLKDPIVLAASVCLVTAVGFSSDLVTERQTWLSSARCILLSGIVDRPYRAWQMTISNQQRPQRALPPARHGSDATAGQNQHIFPRFIWQSTSPHGGERAVELPNVVAVGGFPIVGFLQGPKVVLSLQFALFNGPKRAFLRHSTMAVLAARYMWTKWGHECGLSSMRNTYT